MSKSFRVVIADDSLDERYCLRRLLERAGHQVVAEAEAGEDLIKQCASTSPDIAITDVRMSGIDGLAAAATITKTHSIPVVAVSAYFDDELVDRANACSVFSYLIKPVRQEDLLAMIPVVVHRFQEFQLLREEATSARQALEDRKDIERAKGILMKKCGLDEPSAFLQLQKWHAHIDKR